MPNFRVIGTKIDQESFEQLSAISTLAGVKNYNILQTVLDCVIKTVCKAEIPNKYSASVLRSFADFSKVRGGFSFIAPNLSEIETPSIIALADGRTIRKKSRILEPVLISKKEDGSFSVVTNGDRLLSAFFGAYSPGILKKLQTIKKENNFNSLSEALRYSLDETLGSADSFSQDVAELFSDNMRSQFGERMDNSRSRRTMINSLESFERRERRKESGEDKNLQEIGEEDLFSIYKEDSLEIEEKEEETYPENIEEKISEEFRCLESDFDNIGDSCDCME